jgi:hypothetical protein
MGMVTSSPARSEDRYAIDAGLVVFKTREAFARWTSSSAIVLLAPTVGLVVNNLIWGRRCD